MSVETIIFNAVKGLVGNRAFPDFAPSGTVTPYITWQQVGGKSIVYTTKEQPDKLNGRFQFKVWSQTRSEANSLAVQIENALIALNTVQAEPLGAFSAVSEPDVKEYGTMQDFSIWSDR